MHKISINLFCSKQLLLDRKCHSQGLTSFTPLLLLLPKIYGAKNTLIRFKENPNELIRFLVILGVTFFLMCSIYFAAAWLLESNRQPKELCLPRSDVTMGPNSRRHSYYATRQQHCNCLEHSVWKWRFRLDCQISN